MARDAIAVFEHSYNLKNDKLLSVKVLIIDYLRHFFEVASPISGRVVAVLASILCREWRGLVCSLLLSYFFVYIRNRIITAIVMPQFCHNELWQME